MSKSSDRHLVARCLGGCNPAWQELYARIERTISYIVRWKHWGFSHQQAEEIVQEALNNFIGALNTFDFKCSLETFASTIARNKCISEIRRQCATKRAAERLAISLQGYEYIPGAAESNERRLVKTEEHRLLCDALKQMGESCRTILRLRYYEEYSYKQIAELLNIPEGTVASRLKRSLVRLRKKVEQCMDIC